MLSPSPLVRCEVINLVDSDEDIWVGATPIYGHYVDHMPPRSPLENARNPVSPPTLGMVNVEMWDPFPIPTDNRYRQNAVSPDPLRSPLQRVSGRGSVPRRRRTIPAVDLSRQPSSTPSEVNPRSRTPDSLISETSDFCTLSDDISPGQSHATRDINANRQESTSLQAYGSRNAIDLSILSDDDLMVYIADHPLDQDLPLDPGLHVTTTEYARIDLTAEEPPLSYEAYATQVIEVFPDVSHDHLELLWTERVPPAGSLERPLFKQDQIAQTVILQLIEKTDYPREKPKLIAPKRKRSSVIDSSEDELADWRVKRVKLRFDIDYIREMTITLLNEFLLVPSDHVKRVCRAQIFLYESLLTLAQGDKNENKHENYQALKQTRKTRVSPHVPPKEVAEVLRAEFAAARKLISKREAHRKKMQEAKDAAIAEQVLAEEIGAMCECQCCFTDTPISRAVHCNGNGTHFFCTDCALNYAKAQTEKGQYQLDCFATTECKANFSHSDKLRFLDAEMLKLLDKLEQNDIMRIAEIEGLAKCPFCDYAEIYPNILENKVFRCKASACMKASCRLCNFDSHIPKTCAEAKAENGISERHILEEAMTEALVRKCPKCQTPVLKDDGCNKMICTKCRCAICDYCGKDITKEGYSHFAGQGTNRPNACPNYDDTFTRNDARIKAAQKGAMDKIRAENPVLSEEDLKIKFSEKVTSGPERRAGMLIRPLDIPYRHLQDRDWFYVEQEAMAILDRANRANIDQALRGAQLDAQMPPRLPPNPFPPAAVAPARAAERHGTSPVLPPFFPARHRADHGPALPLPQAYQPDAPDDHMLAREYLARRQEQNEEFRRTQERLNQRRRERQREIEDINDIVARAREPTGVEIHQRVEAPRERTNTNPARARQVRNRTSLQRAEAAREGSDMLTSRIERLNRRFAAHQEQPAEELERVMREPWHPADDVDNRSAPAPRSQVVETIRAPEVDMVSRVSNQARRIPQRVRLDWEDEMFGEGPW